MPNQRTLPSIGTLAFVSLALILASVQQGSSQGGGVKNLMYVQGVTPGVSQSGHSNISGTMRAGQFIGGGAGLSNVIAAGLALPYNSTLPSAPANVFDLRVTTATPGSVLYARNGSASVFADFSASVVGDSATVPGVIGRSNVSHGVRGYSSQNSGVYGFTQAVGQAGVYGESTFAGTSGVLGVALEVGVLGRTTGSAGIAGVYGESSATTGVGVVGRVTAGTGNSVAVSGIASSASGVGVSGSALAETGSTIGVRGTVTSTAGIGVLGRTSHPSSGIAGVRGESLGLVAPAIQGINTATGGVAYGGYFTTQSNGGVAVYSEALSTAGFTTYGGQFISRASNTGRGVQGESYGTASYGVYGVAVTTSGVTNGVRGASLSSAGFGVFSNGNTGASGTKSFVIDHPADPANKYLRHFSAEGPFPLNIYQGKATTDAKGYAWVELPSYFESINTNAQVQLTVVDDSDEFVLAKVTKPVESGRFQLRTSKPNVLVYWEVKAERNDEWVRANPPKVEYEKPAHEKGKYLRPELFGMPYESGIDFVPRRDGKNAGQ